MRAASLRLRLIFVAAGAILPLAIMSQVALQALLDQQRLQTEQSSLDLTRALATAVDTELRLTVSALQMLAATEPFAAENTSDIDIEHSYRLAQRVLVARSEWRALVLADPTGKVLFSTDFPLAGAQPPISDAESFEAARRTQVPVIGSLVRGPLRQSGVPVHIPLLRGGALRFVLTAMVKPDAILQVIERQRVPSDWIVSVFDAKNMRVARSRAHEKYLGTPAAQSLLVLLQQSIDEGAGETTTLEGEKVYTAFTRLKSTGWSVAIGLPTSTAESAWRHSAFAYGGGILLSLGLGGLAAWLVARSISMPIDRLRISALALGRGEAPRPPGGNLLEVQAVFEALESSSRMRLRSEAERDQLLAAERQARSAAEQAQRRLELLASAGSLLSRSLEERSTLESIASIIVPGIADWCCIDLLDAHGALERKLTHHTDPQRAQAVARMAAPGPVPAETTGSFSWVIAHGRTWLANFDSPESSGIADPAFLAFARATGMRANCVVPLVARGRTIGAMGVMQAESGRAFSAEDGVLITELAHRAALALDNVRLFAEAEAALHKAEVASRAKDDFLAMLGHELRNPLAPIVTSLGVMARLEPDAATAQRRVIERQVAHLSALVDDLLDVSRIASGKIRLRKERVDLRDVVARALELAQSALQERTRAPELALPAEPVWVIGDGQRLAQVVSNLLTNAAKFSRPHDRIMLELSADDGSARLVVSDEGSGIAPELIGEVFERFVQGEQALQRAAGGLGLGLAIARSLIELHHGTISAHSAGTGRGSRFVVTLPPAPVAETVAAPVEKGAPPPSTARSTRVLLVDDNADALEAMADLLRIEGYEVLTAESAEGALEHVDAFAPDAGLLDIGLPKMDGYELAQALRANPGTRAMKLIALTGYGRAPDRLRAVEAGFDLHFVKPAPIEELLASLAALVARSTPP